MQKKIQQIRDLEIIEKELNACPVGILALYVENEKVTQIATTFLYQDKNIYLFLDETSEQFASIHFDTNASFAVIKNDRVKKTAKNENVSYQALSITISGNIRKVDDLKIIDDVKANYLSKYSKESSAGDIESIQGSAVIIDTEEIQAIEETGG